MVLGLGKTKLVGATAAKPIDTVETFGLPTATATPAVTTTAAQPATPNPNLARAYRRKRRIGEEGRDNRL